MLTCYANALKRKEEDSVYVLIQSNKLVDLEAAKHKWSFRFSDSGPHCISMAAGLHQSDLQKKAKERKKKKKSPPVSSSLIGSELIPFLASPSHVGRVRLNIVIPYPHISFLSTPVHVPGWIVATPSSASSPSSSSVGPPLPSVVWHHRFKPLHLLPVILRAAAHRMIVRHGDRLHVAAPLALFIHVGGMDWFPGTVLRRRAGAAAAAFHSSHGDVLKVRIRKQSNLRARQKEVLLQEDMMQHDFQNKTPSNKKLPGRSGMSDFL